MLLLIATQGGPRVVSAVLGFLILAVIIACPFLIIFAIVRASKGRSGNSKAQSRREPVFDDCPKPICLHRDKGEHHVRKGREIDPWDRPDIDIRKYQRKN